MDNIGGYSYHTHLTMEHVNDIYGVLRNMLRFEYYVKTRSSNNNMSLTTKKHDDNNITKKETERLVWTTG